MEYHVPVLLKECIEGLAIKPNGIYVDLTFGGGGHSKAILELLNENGKLFAFDQDAEAKQNTLSFPKEQFQFIQANFRYFRKYLKFYGVSEVDGILADLGVSSHQINTPERGFSIRFEGNLDMRMDRNQALTAKEIIQTYSEQNLHKILGMYGEIKNAKTLAQLLVRERLNKPINTTQDLIQVLQKTAPKNAQNKYYAQVFQALRIEVNDELKALEEMLLDVPQVLKPKGRLVVLSYHSLEDRLVKNFIHKGKFYGEIEKDIYGNYTLPLKAINKKPIEASAEEVLQNKRARSAKLRIAEKVD
ncbi:MAG: 16S rRNA (cytosine(1402)-N(4))-methyltransferase RsmH [Microscillaceae bacterium]|nr:16S rRNA (cytosine(1402)-N(4))-methyltransferase RsmH [Microscillaceae bacterium]MDW8460416.1 16S rRNA (cytosine(1402)-N(4))-methyltransferase RsmH [Cytophagales bacterium]